MTKVSSYTQRAGAIKLAYIEEKIKICYEQYNVLKKCGLEKEAIDNVLPKIRDLEMKRKDLRAKLIADRLRGAKMLLMCLCGADLCTELADDFSAIIKEISYGVNNNRNDFSNMLSDVATKMNEVVQLIDEPQNHALSQYYSEMAEEATSAAREAIAKVVDKWMDTDRGKRYF